MLELNKRYVITELWKGDSQCAEISSKFVIFKPGNTIIPLKIEDGLSTIVSVNGITFTQADLDDVGIEFEGFLSNEDLKLRRIELIHSVGDPHPYITADTISTGPLEIPDRVPPIFYEIAENMKEIIRLLKEKQ